MGGDSPPEPPEQAKGHNPIQVIHHLLRGRYHWAIPLALVCGAICGLVLRHMVKDTYSSTGTICVRPTIPRVLVENDENGPLPMYQAYLDMQATLLTSENVIDLAVQDPAWVEIAGPPSPDTAALMLQNLKVAHDGELLTVTYTDRIPRNTVIAVHAAISAYIQLYSQSDEATKSDHIRLLESLKATDTARLATLNQECVEIAAKYGSTSLDALVELKTQEIGELKASERQVELQLVAMQSGPDPSKPTVAPVPDSPEAWALTDHEMATLLDEKVQAEMTLQANRQVLGENSPALQAYELNLQTIAQAIRDRAAFLAKNPPAAGTAAPPVGTVSLESLQSQKRTLDTDLATAYSELADLGKSNVRLKQINNEQTTLQQQLTETGQSLEELGVENVAGGRIDVLSYGDRPQLQTSKRSLLTGAGGVMGAMGVFACITLLELRNRRVRHIADVQPGGSSSGSLTLLGAVPTISDERPDVDQEAVAYAVHKIRANLQIGASRKDQRVVAVTSPVSGNGKTSMVLALGISFAGSGSRTLMIDGDIIGGGLTSRLNVAVRRDVVQILRRNTRISEEQISRASQAGASEAGELLQKLVDLGSLDRATALRVANIHRESSVGILDAMAGDNLEDCISSTRWQDLYVLPRGTATAVDAAHLSPRGFRDLLRRARSTYDMVLIDTGPIFGSLEATLATSEADGAVLVVSRGGSAAEVRKAVSELENSGGVVLGAIFNRAKISDMAGGGYSASYRAQAQSTRNGESGPATGPVATALVRTSPRLNGGNRR